MFRLVVLPCFDLGLTVPMYIIIIFQLFSHPNLAYTTPHHTHSEEVLTDRAAADEFNIIPAPPLYEELNYLPSKVCT